MRQACERNMSGARVALAQSLARCNLAAVAKFAYTLREPPSKIWLPGMAWQDPRTHL